MCCWDGGVEDREGEEMVGQFVDRGDGGGGGEGEGEGIDMG